MQFYPETNADTSSWSARWTRGEKVDCIQQGHPSRGRLSRRSSARNEQTRDFSFSVSKTRASCDTCSTIRTTIMYYRMEEQQRWWGWPRWSRRYWGEFWPGNSKNTAQLQCRQAPESVRHLRPNPSYQTEELMRQMFSGRCIPPSWGFSLSHVSCACLQKYLWWWDYPLRTMGRGIIINMRSKYELIIAAN